MLREPHLGHSLMAVGQFDRSAEEYSNRSLGALPQERWLLFSRIPDLVPR